MALGARARGLIRRAGRPWWAGPYALVQRDSPGEHVA